VAKKCCFSSSVPKSEYEAYSSNAHVVICNNELDDIDTSFSENLKNAAIGANKGRSITSSKF
jgi:hypothetical protein